MSHCVEDDFALAFYLKNAAVAGLKEGHFCGPQTEVLPTVGNTKRAQKSGEKLEPETVPVCCSF